MKPNRSGALACTSTQPAYVTSTVRSCSWAASRPVPTDAGVRCMPNERHEVRQCPPLCAVRYAQRAGGVQGHVAQNRVYDVHGGACQMRQGAAVLKMHQDGARFVVLERRRSDAGVERSLSPWSQC